MRRTKFGRRPRRARYVERRSTATAAWLATTAERGEVLQAHMERLQAANASQDLTTLLRREEGDQELGVEQAISKKQLWRLAAQAHVLWKFYSLRLAQLKNGGDSTQVQHAAEAGSEFHRVSATTVIRWHKEWVENDGHLLVDHRGSWLRSWIMNEHDLLEKLTNFMLENQQALSKLLVHKYINEELLTEANGVTAELMTTYGVALPISEFTALQWMHTAGAVSGWFRADYYNDKHQDPEVLADRVEYIGYSEQLERRMPCWFQLPKRAFDRHIKPGRELELAGVAAIAAEQKREDPPPLDAMHEPEAPLLPGARVQITSRSTREEARARLGTVHGVEPGVYLVTLDGPGVQPPVSFEHKAVQVLGTAKTVGRVPFPYTDSAGREMVECHVDTCAAHWREAYPMGGQPSVRRPEARRQCEIHTGTQLCFCHLLIVKLGHDEAVYKSNAKSKHVWIINDRQLLRSKSEGTGEMVSAVQDDETGFGFIMSAEELAATNAYRASKGRLPLMESAGLRYLKFGVHRDGYWDNAQFLVQVEDLMDCFAIKYPERQMVLEVDHSQGHHKGQEDGLNVNTMNAGWGKKQKSMRVTTGTRLTADSLGDEPLVMVFKAGEPIPEGLRGQETVSTAAALDTESDSSDSDDSEEEEEETAAASITPAQRPCGFPSGAGVPRSARWVLSTEQQAAAERYAAVNRAGMEEARANAVETARDRAASKELQTIRTIDVTALLRVKDGDVQHLQFQAGDLPPFYAPNAKDYVGEPKGLKQVLWERGLWKDGMKVGDCRERLAACEDFAKEESALEKLVHDRGHLVVFTPKGHPEIAGCGIEYSWGKSKYEFRRANVGKKTGTVVDWLHKSIVATFDFLQVGTTAPRVPHPWGLWGPHGPRTRRISGQELLKPRR